MGLFSRNFNKPGPGVRKDEPRKTGAARFFELLLRDFGDLIKLNLMFCICAAPTLLVFLFGMTGLYTGIAIALSLVFAFPVGGALVSYVYYITMMMRDQPSYVWFEFKRKFKENYKQAAPIGMICAAFIYAQVLLWVSLIFTDTSGDLLWFIVAIISMLLFGMIAPYVFMHLAYIDLGTFRILKNSILMAFGYLPRSFMASIMGSILWILFILFLPVSLMLLPLILLITASLSILMSLSWVWKPFNEYFKVEETLIEKAKEED
ncbi:MAG: DUF624 domain-containing protein [Oscillospiraceae bacterium]|nr:DUF624 domain-containing protein [Oscillospiraceae bacterium]